MELCCLAPVPAHGLCSLTKQCEGCPGLGTQKSICRSISEKKESMDLMNQKEVKEIYKIRNTSKEEILCVLQTRHHFLQPSVLCAICKRDIERKQVVPVSRGNTPCKCIHIADGSKKKSICTMAKNKESLLAKIKLMTGEQMQILDNDFFDQEVECLKRRVGQVECTKTHEEMVKTSLQKVSELEKEVNAILADQEETSAAAPAPQVEDADTDTPRDINSSLETKG
ncbi:hypothetical protein HGM15179_006806 [Zosterops borbonicus]|uniref:ATF7-interacting protein protein binding domain-containing protein n=1 Tax=Zosterops borbonicus TaxID=364589 RepID=A0A8K1LN15_9PASS|nr:hypothetical protein HGM15179_006806 [Zosterops borbonicus]